MALFRLIVRLHRHLGFLVGLLFVMLSPVQANAGSSHDFVHVQIDSVDGSSPSTKAEAKTHKATRSKKSRQHSKSHEVSKSASESESASQSVSHSTSADAEAVAVRRLRVQRVLVTLDRVAEVALKMEPERAQALEPVILDIAEQTMDLKSDEELDQVEETVGRLVLALNRLVEPEMSL